MIHEEIKKKPKPEYATVTLHTWGSHMGGGNGLANFMDSVLFGANCGHASLELTFPADATGQALIDQYCTEGNKILIPHERYYQRVIDNETKEIRLIEMYKVYFSWWPGRNDGHALQETINQDKQSERLGVDVGPMNPKFRGVLDNNQETRINKGLLGKRENRLISHQIAHLTALTEEQKRIIELESLVTSQAALTNSLGILVEKLNNIQKESSISDSLLLLLNTHIPDWNINVQNKNKMTEHEAKKISAIASLKLSTMTEEISKNSKKMEAYQLQYFESQQLLIRESVDALKKEISQIEDFDEKKHAHVFNKYTPKVIAAYRVSLLDLMSNEINEIMNFLTTQPPTATSIYGDGRIPSAFFDDIFPEGTSENMILAVSHWRQYLPENYATLQKNELDFEKEISLHEHFLKKLEAIASEKTVQEHIYAKSPGDISNFHHQSYEAAITAGLPPDNTIILPVRSISYADHNDDRHGMNIEAMLSRMHELAKSGGEFDLFVNNCSSTTGSILSAGAEPELQHYFHEKACGVFGNPQVVFNGAMHYTSTAIERDGKIPLTERLNRFNPLNAIQRAAGNLVHYTLRPDVSPVKKAALFIPCIVMAVPAGAAEIIKSVINPKKSFDACLQFMSYANNNPSLFLKTSAIPVAGLAAALAIPAGLQQGLSKIYHTLKKYRSVPISEQQHQILANANTSSEQASPKEAVALDASVAKQLSETTPYLPHNFPPTSDNLPQQPATIVTHEINPKRLSNQAHGQPESNIDASTDAKQDSMQDTKSKSSSWLLNIRKTKK